jgi:hypothetical protein
LCPWKGQTYSKKAIGAAFSIKKLGLFPGDDSEETQSAGISILLLIRCFDGVSGRFLLANVNLQTKKQKSFKKLFTGELQIELIGDTDQVLNSDRHHIGSEERPDKGLLLCGVLLVSVFNKSK